MPRNIAAVCGTTATPYSISRLPVSLFSLYSMMQSCQFPIAITPIATGLVQNKKPYKNPHTVNCPDSEIKDKWNN